MALSKREIKRRRKKALSMVCPVCKKRWMAVLDDEFVCIECIIKK